MYRPHRTKLSGQDEHEMTLTTLHFLIAGLLFLAAIVVLAIGGM